MKLILIFGIALFIGLTSADSDDGSCNLLCPAVYMPVCGMEVKSDGTNEIRIFSNSCAMGAENMCNKRNFVSC
ncbi:unnamed protein product [Nezara viridula]|uniref:Kazal-like domain-containing protein n=1 Tax=Nezara viridula TaxID=85310 RepID=A0A9P0E7N6_NEZVI|nr:unnamed protein product [Nezara viridula]